MKNKAMKYIQRVCRDKRNQLSSTFAALLSILLSLLASCFYDWYTRDLSADVQSIHQKIMLVVVIILTIVCTYGIVCLSEYLKKIIWPERYNDKYMRHAFLHVRKLGANRQASFQEASHSESEEKFFINEALRNMQLVVQCCYDFFCSAYSETGELIDTIKFESTFITKSYKDDNLTIPCSANKENRTPTSMIHRQRDPQILNGTEAAKLYKATRPQLVIIEDTSKSNDYKETYDDQKKRICSSLILPVLSHENIMLGALVVHCNKPGFFSKSDYDFWNELLELFSVELGYHKLLLDYYVSKVNSEHKPF